MIAKNYLSETQIKRIERAVSGYEIREESERKILAQYVAQGTMDSYSALFGEEKGCNRTYLSNEAKAILANIF